MRSYIGLVPRYIKKQSRRSMLAIMGIVLSVALITSTGVLGESIEATYLENIKEMAGSHHARFDHITDQQASVLENHAKIGKAGMMDLLGVCHIPDEMLALNIGSWDDDLQEMVQLSMVKGTFPQKENEIVLEESILSKLNLKNELGQTIPLEYELPAVDLKDKKAPRKGQAEFILAGIYKNLSEFGGGFGGSYGIVSDGTVTQLRQQERAVYSSFIQVKESLPIKQTIQDIADNVGIKAAYNHSLLRALGEEEGGSQRAPWARAILIAIVVVATVVGIYNVFHISVLERIRQFGILRSIGTTPRQARRIVFGEALFISLIAVPVGILVGIAASQGLALLLEQVLSEIRQIKVSLRVIGGVTAISMGSVLVSAWNPARLAGKVSPMEAILNNSRIVKQSKVKQRKWHRVIQKLTGITGRMAYQNLWRNKKRFLVTVVSMCIGVVLFIVFSYYISIFGMLMEEEYVSSDYVIKTNMISSDGSNGYSKKDFEEIQSVPGVTQVRKTQFGIGVAVVPEEKMREVLKKEGSPMAHLQGKMSKEGFPVSCHYYGYDEELLKEAEKFLLAGEVDMERMKEESAVLLVGSRTDLEGQSKFKVGDEVAIRVGTREGKEIKVVDKRLRINGIIEKLPMEIWSGSGITLVFSETMYQEVFQSDLYHQFEINAQDSADKEMVKERLRSISQNLRGGAFVSYEEQVEQLNEMRGQIMMLAYGLAAIIFIIGAFNIINTISSNLILRTREFGMLRSVGMTGIQLKRMVRMEGILYGVISAFWGSVIGSVLAYGLYLLIKADMHDISWSIPWEAILIALAANIIVSLLATLAPLKRISSMNIIDAVRTIE